MLFSNHNNITTTFTGKLSYAKEPQKVQHSRWTFMSQSQKQRKPLQDNFLFYNFTKLFYNMIKLMHEYCKNIIKWLARIIDGYMEMLSNHEARGECKEISIRTSKLKTARRKTTYIYVYFQVTKQYRQTEVSRSKRCKFPEEKQSPLLKTLLNRHFLSTYNVYYHTGSIRSHIEVCHITSASRDSIKEVLYLGFV